MFSMKQLEKYIIKKDYLMCFLFAVTQFLVIPFELILIITFYFK